MSQNENYQVKNKEGFYELYDKDNFLIKTKKTPGAYKNVRVAGEPISVEKTHEQESDLSTTKSTTKIVTQEDLENNPDLIDEGVKVGDEITIYLETGDLLLVKSENSFEENSIEGKDKATMVDTSNENLETSNEKVDTSNENVDTSEENVDTSEENVENDTRTISEWCVAYKLELITDDGFRPMDNKSRKNQKITEEDFQSGISKCAVKNIL